MAGSKKGGGKKKVKRSKKKIRDPHVEIDYDGPARSERPRFACLNYGCEKPCEPKPWCCEDCSGTWYCSRKCYENSMRHGVHGQLCRKCKGASNVRVDKVDRLGESQVGLFSVTGAKRGQPILNLTPYVLGRLGFGDRDLAKVRRWKKRIGEISTADFVGLFDAAYDSPYAVNGKPYADVRAANAGLNILFGCDMRRADGTTEKVADIVVARKWIRGHVCHYEKVRGADDARDEMVRETLINVSHYFAGYHVRMYEPYEMVDGHLTEGYFPFVCWMNHDCNPNVDLVNMMGNVLIVPKRDIGPGEELTMTYIPTHDLLPAKARRQTLKEHMMFTCLCETCEKDLTPWCGLHPCEDPDDPDEVASLSRRIETLKEALALLRDDPFEAEPNEDKLLGPEYVLHCERECRQLLRADRRSSKVVEARQCEIARKYDLHRAAQLYSYFLNLCCKTFVTRGVLLEQPRALRATYERLKEYSKKWREATKTRNKLGRPSSFVSYQGPQLCLMDYVMRFALLMYEVEMSDKSESANNYEAVLDEMMNCLKPMIPRDYDPILYFVRMAPFSPVVNAIVMIEMARRVAKCSGLDTRQRTLGNILGHLLREPSLRPREREKE